MAGLVFAEIFQIVFLLIGLGIIFLGMLLRCILALGVSLVLLGILVIVAGVLLSYVLFNCFKLNSVRLQDKKEIAKRV